MKSIFLVLDFEPAFYEGDRDETRIKAISTDLDTLCKSFIKNAPSGQLLEFTPEAFNKNLYLTISSDSIDESESVKVISASFPKYIKEHYHENSI